MDCSQLYFSLPSVRKKVTLYEAKWIERKRQRYNKVYFLKSKLIHSHQFYLKFYSKKYYTNVVWNIKHK